MTHICTPSNHVPRMTLAHLVITDIVPFHSTFLQGLQYLVHLFSSIRSLELERDEYVCDGGGVYSGI